jgi:hypothetical protein
MRSTHRALATLALGLALVGSTTAAAFAVPAPSTDTDQRTALYQPELAANLQRSDDGVVTEQRKALYQSELAANLQRSNDGAAVATATAAGTDELAQRKALYESELGASPQRRDHPVVYAPVFATQPAAAGVNVLAILLLGLAGGLVGAGALIAGRGIATRRRPHRTAAAT